MWWNLKETKCWFYWEQTTLLLGQLPEEDSELCSKLVRFKFEFIVLICLSMSQLHNSSSILNYFYMQQLYFVQSIVTMLIMILILNFSERPLCSSWRFQHPSSHPSTNSCSHNHNNNDNSSSTTSPYKQWSIVQLLFRGRINYFFTIFQGSLLTI